MAVTVKLPTILRKHTGNEARVSVEGATLAEGYFAESPMGETRRARAAEVIATQRTEFQAHDLEIGFSYADGALVPDGSEAPPRDPMGSVYHPTTRPGQCTIKGVRTPPSQA